MMGIPQSQSELFNYSVNLDQRVRTDHPLRRVAQAVDFSFVRDEVAHCYGENGNESVDPVILLKMMFLLFFDNVPSERELMAVIRERLDYLWFLGCGLDDDIPNHSVLSKARKRWGKEVFERLFVRSVEQCVAAGLVGGDKPHVDASLVAANASKDSVIKGSPELIAAYKAAYAVAGSKLDEPPRSHPSYEAVNDRMVSTTDPAAGLMRKRLRQPPPCLSPSPRRGRRAGRDHGGGHHQRSGAREPEAHGTGGSTRAKHRPTGADGRGRPQVWHGRQLRGLP
jgi:transposase